MKKIFILFMSFLLTGVVLFISCKKEKSCEGCINGNRHQPPLQGPTRVITLPTYSISLDGSAFSDQDGTISEWLWTKISGPASFNINNSSATLKNSSNRSSCRSEKIIYQKLKLVFTK